MPAPAIDALTSGTLKHLRESWWDDAFTAFLVDTLKPRPGNRILDVGCGEGLAEVMLGRRQISQIRLVGIDNVVDKAVTARRETAAHNQRAFFAAADAVRLPFQKGAFNSLYCIAVLQHVHDVDAAVAEFARVTASGGRVVAVEPDNSARYTFSSVPSGKNAFDAASRFFSAIALERGDAADAVTIGPRLPALFARHGIEPLDVKVFPVSQVALEVPSDEVWNARKAAVVGDMERASSATTRSYASKLLDAIDRYAEESRAAGAPFVEIQNAMMFATVGQRVA